MSILNISREFFQQEVLPVLKAKFPQETERITFGLFGHGSEALKMDDQYSADHHFGLRIDALMPDDIFAKREQIMQVVGQKMPQTFKGYELGESTRAGAGIAPDNLKAFLMRTIGIDHPPQTAQEWLNLPEEDVIHLVNGEVWSDPSGEFSAIRNQLLNYYPDEVWYRRMAHWCRYFSGMGTYALKRAILRDNEVFAAITFGKTVRWGIQLAFMIDRTYFPYDKWVYPFFKTLPRMYDRMGSHIEEAVKLSTSWQRKLELLDDVADILDQTMVDDGIIPPHPKFEGSPTSGYRLMEHAYKVLLDKVSDEVRAIVPLWDQVYLEQFVVGYVHSISQEAWDDALNLTPIVD